MQKYLFCTCFLLVFDSFSMGNANKDVRRQDMVLSPHSDDG